MRYEILILLVLFGAACGTSLNYIETAAPPRKLHARSAKQVEIFMTSKPNRPFVEIGMIESQQEEFSQDDAQTVIAKMRGFAGEHGCDALVIFADNDVTQVSGGKDFTVSGTLKGYRGSCLVYTGPPEAPAAAAPLAANSCMLNSTQLCYGPGGCRGGQRCTEDGKGYTPCDCGTAAPPTAGEVAADSGTGR